MRDLKALLRSLGLLVTASSFEDLIALATKKRWGAAELLEHIADLEDKDRARRGLERRMARSKLETFKPMADFDWDWPTTIDRGLVESLLTLDFLDGARNVVLVAPGGLGKTMIAQNLAHRAILAGRSVLFLLPSGFFDGYPIQVFDAHQGAGAMHATVEDGFQDGVRAR
jgi:DNA replication protein DnaC